MWICGYVMGYGRHNLGLRCVEENTRLGTAGGYLYKYYVFIYIDIHPPTDPRVTELVSIPFPFFLLIYILIDPRSLLTRKHHVII